MNSAYAVMDNEVFCRTPLTMVDASECSAPARFFGVWATVELPDGGRIYFVVKSDRYPGDRLPIRFIKFETRIAQPESASPAIRPFAYFRSMWSILKSTFLHPFSTTTIDLDTGRVVGNG